MKKFRKISAEKFENNTLRLQVTSRGGGVEIDLTKFGYKGKMMTAYQNYLGGGMLGGIGNDCTIRDWEGDEKLNHIAKELRMYFHSLSNPDEDEWESQSFEQVESLPLSAY